ncbi:hypothetical protein DLREEDagrD3_28710 [Denitratisoma sp. agr-D3]
MTHMDKIEQQAKRYSEARDKVTAIVTALNTAMDALKRTEIPKLRKAIAAAAEHHDQLKSLIEQAPELFAKPKTQTFHGIRLGFVKGKGKIEWEDADQVVRLIKKHFPDQADVLVVTTEKPAKDALNNLTAAELKKLGISVSEGDEAVFIKPADSAVDKMVDALLKSATEEVSA